jgi:protein TonB
MMRSTLLSFAAVALVSASAPQASGRLPAVRQFAAQPPASAVQADDASWPPADAFRQGKDGVTPPRLLHQASPQYSAEAMREQIQGNVGLECVVETDGSVKRVRVVRSVDKLFGLDEQAVKAAKQWQFSPGMKDNVAVPVLITIDLTFTLRGPLPPPTEWPEPFTPSSAAQIDTAEWAENVLDVQGLRIRVSYPKTWASRPEARSNRLLFLQSAGGRGTRIFFVENPKPARVQIGSGVTADTLQRLADSARQKMTTPAGSEVKGFGQARAADRFWIWYDVWLPISETANTLAEVLEGSRMWTFVTTEGQQEIVVGCIVLYPKNAPAAIKQQELEQAGAEFAAMLKHVSFQIP